MTRRDMPGARRGTVDDRIKANSKYRDEDYSTRFTRDFLSLKNEHINEIINSRTDDSYLYALCKFPTNTKEDGIETMAGLYTEGHFSGHMKDKDTTEEDAYFDICCELWNVIGELRNDKVIADRLENPDFDDTTATTIAAYKPLEISSTNEFIEGMVDRNMVIPQFIVDLLYMFTGHYIKLTDPYEIYGTNYPEAGIATGIRYNTLATLQTNRNAAFGDMGDAKQHMNKFGIKYVPVTKELIYKNMNTYDLKSNEALFLLQDYQLQWYGTDTSYTFLPWGGVNFDGGTDWSDWSLEYYMPPSPSAHYAFTMCGHGHHATNNPYGGLYQQISVANNDGDVNLLRWAINDTDPNAPVDIMNTAADKHLPVLFPQMWPEDRNGTAGTMDIGLHGTKVSTDYSFDAWLPSIMLGAIKGNKTISATAGKNLLESFLEKWVIGHMF
jgi:hypothetical protein